MLLVVFGAGASYDSVADLPPPRTAAALQQSHENDRPPLANELFGNRKEFVEAMQLFEDCLPIVPFLRGKSVAVEQELAKLQEQAKAFPRAQRELIAVRFYIHYSLWECERRWEARHHRITNYGTLIREIERWRYETKEQICFVTFNYDTMLENAMIQVLGYNFQDLSEYVSQGDYSLIKLHGSINWGRELDGLVKPTHHSALINGSSDLRFCDGYRQVVRRGMYFQDNSVGFPALAIPIHKKDEFSCPAEHIEKLAKVIPRVNKVITIGWRASEDNFLKMLAAPLSGLACMPKLLIVSGDAKGAQETYSNLGAKVNQGGALYVLTGFTGLINSIGELNEFLRMPAPALP